MEITDHDFRVVSLVSVLAIFAIILLVEKRYIAAQENGTEGDLVVQDAALLGITDWGFEKRFHTDGTVDEPEDPFADFSGIVTEVMALAEKAQAGEEIDIVRSMCMLLARGALISMACVLLFLPALLMLCDGLVRHTTLGMKAE